MATLAMQSLRAKWYKVLLLFAFALCVRHFSYLYLPVQRWEAGLESKSAAQNETLGFGAIYVLTEDVNTWRVQGLLRAANLVGLQLRIPIQHHPSDDEVYTHLAGDEPPQFLDEIRAVLNYIRLLETFLDTGYETALFFEDDVDFGVDIKAQMDVISLEFLTHNPNHEGHRVDAAEDHKETDDQLQGNELLQNDIHEHPYGKGLWDVLWLGHFGVELTPQTLIWYYHDSFALPWDRLNSTFNNYYELVRAQNTEEAGFPKQQQVAHTVAPMSTYAFALTRANAQRLVHRLRSDRIQKFDLALHIQCKGLEQKCVAPVPEVMHHHKVQGQSSIGRIGDERHERHDLTWWRTQRKYTFNLGLSARCNAAGVGERLGPEWQCLPGEYDVEI